MLDQATFVLAFLAALGSALMAGTFFAFSAFVMGALERLPAPQGIAAMQSVNIVVINPLFLGAFLGTGAVSAVLIVLALLRLDAPRSVWLIAGSLLYIVGTNVVTMRFNVPLNDRLAVADPESADGAGLWRRYLVDWTFWNHVRTAAPLAALACFILALR